MDEEAFEQLLSAAYVMQEHNSRLKKIAAQPEALVMPMPTEVAPSSATTGRKAVEDSLADPESHASIAATCRSCGHLLTGQESFCGSCGAPREAGSSHAKTWASLWDMHQVAEHEQGETPAASTPWESAPASTDSETVNDEVELFPVELEEIVAQFAEKDVVQEPQPEVEEAEAAETALVSAPTGAASPTSPEASPWASAARARAWLDSLRGEVADQPSLAQLWKKHRGTLSIAAASLFLLLVIVDWGVRPAPRPDGTRDLSVFQKVLVSLGLAEVSPSSQINRGNPSTQVWVDPHTALYYCPGADLYGKTKDGRFSSQLDAQRDQFEPATRKACD